MRNWSSGLGVDDHPLRERIQRIAGCADDDLQARRPRLRASRRRDAVERADRGEKARVDRGRQRMGGEDQPIDAPVEPDRAEPEAPLLALRDRDRHRQVAVLDRLDRTRLHAVDPAGGERGLQSGRIAGLDAVEPQRLRAALADADQRRALVFQREPVRRLEGEAELGMQEAAPEREPLRGIVAEGDAVDRAEISVARGLANAGRRDLTRLRDRLGDAFGRGGMGRHHVRLVVAEPSPIMEARSALQRPSESRKREAA